MSKPNTIVTLGSHSALQILHGAKAEGFETALVYQHGRQFYKTFRFVDKLMECGGVDNALSLVNGVSSAVFVPHGSLVEYFGPARVERIRTKIFGNRSLFEWESNQEKKMRLLEAAKIQTPRSFDSPGEVDGTVIVKLPGAKGGSGYFIARDKREAADGIRRLIQKKIVKRREDLMIQEYVVGVPMYFQFFYSPVLNRVELTGIDIRYESNVDGLRRIPFGAEVSPSFTVVGNLPAVVRESLLPAVFDYGERFVATARKLVPGGVIGPFCLEAMVTERQQIVVFEFSARIVAGTNLYVDGSPYSWFYWDEPMSVGRRIAREIKMASENGHLERVVT